MTKIVLGIVGVLVAFFVLSSSVTVDVGERVLVVGFGQVKETLGQGWHVINPFYSTHTFTLRNNKYETTASSASADLQKADIDVVVNYNIDESKIVEIYTTYGNDYMGRLFAQSVQDAVKNASVKYTASELRTKGEQFKTDIKDSLQAKMPNGIIIITNISIADIRYSESFDKSVEAKVVAEQRALEAKANLEQKRYEAEAIRAQAEAIKSAGGAEYVQLEWIKKWNGVMPQYITGGNNLISIPAIGK